MSAVEDPTAADTTNEPKTPPILNVTPASVLGEPTNPALEEPDAAAILRKGSATTASVTHDRKQELLVQARLDRRQWVRQVPLPYATARDPTDSWASHDRLQPVQSSIVCQKMPVITKVLSELYGMESQIRTPESVAERVDQLIQPFLMARNAPNGSDFNEEQLVQEVEAHQDEAIHAYYQFWSTLLMPECALLVQGMRNFLGNLHDADTMERVAAGLKSFVDSTISSTLPLHPAWRNQDLVKVKRSLESFLYGHAQPILDRLEWTGLFAMDETQWMDKITQLQFVQAEHLEIQCLNQTGALVEELLRDPVCAMVSIDQYYSPYEKLQRILLVYQGVNSALSAALNDLQSTSADRKLPSADDVLPTIILTVLKAKPARLLRNLQLIEVFAPQEYLRGEAGYAYTNLYGAVQFLQDLNMDKPDSLSISAEDFKKGLEETVKKTQERLQIADATKYSLANENNDAISIDISVNDVRDARLKGETINLEWAINHGINHPEKCGLGGHHDKTNATASLPPGFTRSYAFLSASPQDIRLSDLPKLLAEYKMLAHVTEQLLAERGARVAKANKKKDLHKSRQLDDTFFGIGTANDSPAEHDQELSSRS